MTKVEDATEIAVASFAQERLWFLAQLDHGSEAYHVPIGLHLQGALDEAALDYALNALVMRHETLRTTFLTLSGVLHQRIAANAHKIRVIHEDWRNRASNCDALVERLHREYSKTFDLQRGPLLRCCVLRLGDEESVLLLTMHHIVSDGWSVGIVTRELHALYSAYHATPAVLKALPIQYADYTLWQRQQLKGTLLSTLGQYWCSLLADAPAVLSLPIDKARPPQQEFRGADVAVTLDAALTRALNALIRRHGVTLFMAVFAAWAIVLARLSSQNDLVIGVPSANRRQVETEGLIGLFVNTLPVRVRIRREQTVGALLKAVRTILLEADAHQDLPFERVVELLKPTRSLKHAPVFQVMFAWQQVDNLLVDFGGLRGSWVGGLGYSPARVDLTLSLGVVRGQVLGTLNYSTALFDEETAGRIAGYLQECLRQMIRDDANEVWKIPLLSSRERSRLVVQWNATRKPYPQDNCVHELFEEQVRLSPQAIAVVCARDSLTYEQLNSRANQVAHYLRARGIGPGSRVAICVVRSLGMVVGILGILKAGAAYVPLDPGYPAARLGEMVRDCEPQLLLTHAAAGERLGQTLKYLDSRVPVVELNEAILPTGIDVNLPCWQLGVGAKSLVYVIYTSGSTGAPKGAMNQHEGLINRLVWMRSQLNVGVADAILQKTPFSFDVSVWELFLPLISGARLVMAAPEGHRDPEYLGGIIQSQHITVIHFVPSMLKSFVAAGQLRTLGAVRHVICSGEVLSQDLVAELSGHIPGRLWNLYGPTEASIDVTCYECANDDCTRVPIGRPVSNTQCYVLDENHDLLPTGSTGELYLGGVQIGLGYWKRPAQTAERFLPDPFGGTPGARLYRTGDLARYRTDGLLEFLGRNDYQVKLRGHRIELGEIEARLLGHPAIGEAVVVAQGDVDEQRLVAYCTTALDQNATSSESIRAYLQEQLPEFMLPVAYVWLNTMPLSANGKLDRRQLPAPDLTAFGRTDYETPVGDVERQLARIWSDLLKVERVGRKDSFFALGGHSLLAVQLASRVLQDMSIEMGIRTVFQHPELMSMADSLKRLPTLRVSSIGIADRSLALPLSWAQQGLWFMARLDTRAALAFHMPVALQLRGKLDRSALRQALNEIMARHESLRTRFALLDGMVTQQIDSSNSGFPIREESIAEESNYSAPVLHLIENEANFEFDLMCGPPIRGRLIKISDDLHILLITVHHIAGDGWSIGLFFKELVSLYEAFRRGDRSSLPALPVQYADYAVWQREWLQGERLQQQEQYWLDALADAPFLLSLPTDHVRPVTPDYAGAAVPVLLDKELTTALARLSERLGATLFTTLLAGWGALLGRLANQTDVVVGTVVSNRARSETERVIGLFVNTLAIRLNLTGSPNTRDLVKSVKETLLDAQTNQDVPFELVVQRLRPERSASYAPLVQVMMAWQDLPDLAGVTLPELEVISLEVPVRTAKLDLALTLMPSDGIVKGQVVFATSLFESDTIRRYILYWKRLLAGMVANENCPVGRLDILGNAERRQVLTEWNAIDVAHKEEPPADQCVSGDSA